MATNSQVCVFQRLAFSSIVGGLKLRPIFSFALAQRGTSHRVVILLDKTQPKKQLPHQAGSRENLVPVRNKATVGIYKVSTILKLDRIPVTFKITIV